MALSQWVLMSLSIIHLVMAGTTVMALFFASADPQGGAALLTGTPLDFLFAQGGFEFSGNFNLGFVFGLMKAIVTKIWGLFWFNYTVLEEGGDVAATFLVVLRIYGMMVLIALLAMFAQRVR